MGVIKTSFSSISSNLKDQWKDLIVCENMPNDLLMFRVTTQTGVISSSSIIRVMPSQCAVICENGRILDIISEEGDYLFDQSASPSIFAGEFKESFFDIVERITFDGESKNQQEVYFFNMKEIIDNKFGTVSPLIYKDFSYVIPNKITGENMPIIIKVKCHGNYTFKISNPILFMREITGTARYYQKANINEKIKSEVIETLQSVLNKLGEKEYNVPVLDLPSKNKLIKDLMYETDFDEKMEERGIKLLNITIENIDIDEKSEEMINEYMMSINKELQEGKIVSAYVQALKDAAKNPSGSINGFLGIDLLEMIKKEKLDNKE